MSATGALTFGVKEEVTNSGGAIVWIAAMGRAAAVDVGILVIVISHVTDVGAFDPVQIHLRLSNAGVATK